MNHTRSNINFRGRNNFRGKFNKNNSRLNKNKGEKPNYNKFINDTFVKNKLISYIYDKIEVRKYKYDLIKYKNDFPNITNEKHFVSPTYNGINGLMVFTKIKDKYYSVIIDRRSLSYNPNQIDLNSVRISNINVQLDNSIYNGTIFDGVLLYNNGPSKKKVFVINDIYYFRGDSLMDEHMDNKILNISVFLNAHKNKDKNLNNIELLPNKLYELKDVKKLVNVHMPKSKFHNSMKGLTFYPEQSGVKLLYLFNNCSKEEEVVEKKKLKDSSKIKIRSSNITADDAVTATFRLKQTDTVDVYSMYLAKVVVKNNKKFVKYKKYGIAYIPTIECSCFCRDIFHNKDVDKDYVLVTCKYDEKKDKWIPFKRAENKKYPDNIKDVEKLFE